jgi:hypothetical protein
MVVPQSLQRHRNSFDLLASQNCFESLADQTKIPDVSLIEFRLNDLALPRISDIDDVRQHLPLWDLRSHVG